MRNRFLAKLTTSVTMLLIAFSAILTLAAPTGPAGASIEILQPDGSRFEGRAFGDEFYSRPTYQGYAITKNSDDVWTYADVINGRYTPTKHVVGKIDPATTGLVKDLYEGDKVIRGYLEKNSRFMTDATWYRYAMEKKINRLVELGAPVEKIEPVVQKYNNLYQSKGYSVDFNKIRAARAPSGSASMSYLPAGIFRAPDAPDYNPPPQQISGKVVGLCILVKFKGEGVPTVKSADIERMFNSESGPVPFNNGGSAYEYFYDMSNGKFQLRNIVTPDYVELPKTKTEYESMRDDGQGFIKDVVEAFNKTYASMDLNPLTLNNNREVMSLSVYYNGVRVSGGALWPKSWQTMYNLMLQGKLKVGPFQMTDIQTAPSIGTFCHESNHMVCDVFDYYDYGDPTRYLCGDAIQSSGVGRYCLNGFGNSSGPGNDGTYPVKVSGYLRYKLGWLNATEVKSTDAISDPIFSSEGNKIYIYRNPMATTEYFLIENRFKSSTARTGILRWDKYLPASGLAIWHVDETVVTGNEYQQSTKEQHYELALMQADGLMHLEKSMADPESNGGDTRDLFYKGNNILFNDESLPAAKWWDGGPSSLSVGQIGSTGVEQSLMFGTIDPNRISVISPAGGEEFYIGQALKISWVAATTVNVDLCLGEKSVVRILKDVPATQLSHTWTIPETVATGTKYKIRVQSTNGAITAYSVGYFSIAREYTRSVGMTISPDSEIVSLLSIPHAALIDKMSVRVNIDMEDASFLDIYLEPSDQWASLEKPMIFAGSQIAKKAVRKNLTNSVFDPLAPSKIEFSSSPFTGRFAPYAFLNGYQGKTAAGVWKLTVKNKSSSQVALFNSWGVSITPKFPSVAFSTWGGVVSADSKMAKITVVSSAVPADGYPVTAYYTLGGSALENVNYTIDTTTQDKVTIPVGKTSADIILYPKADTTMYVGDLTVNFQISAVSNGVLVPPSSYLLSLQDQLSKPVVYITVDSPMLLTPEEGYGKIKVRARLTSPTNDKVRVPIQLTGTAVAGVSYTLSPKDYIDIPQGQTEAVMELDILNDPTYYSSNRVFQIAIQPPTKGNAVIDHNPATPSYLDFVIREKTAIPTLSFVSASQNVLKLNQRILIPFRLSGPCGDVVTFAFTATGSAVYGVNYTIPTGFTASIAPGTLEGAVGVDIIDNRQIDGNTQAYFTIISVLHADPGSPSVHELQILETNYTGIPVVSFKNPSATADIGATVEVALSLDIPAKSTVTVPLRTSGTAIAGIDFEPFNPVVTIPAGKYGNTFKIKLLKSKDFAPAKTMQISLYRPENAVYTISGSTYNLTIENTNPAPVVALKLLKQQSVRQGKAEVSMTVSPVQSTDILVPYTVITSLTEGVDYTVGGSVVAGSFKLPRGMSEATMTVALTPARQEKDSQNELLVSYQDPANFVLTGKKIQTLSFVDVNQGAGTTLIAESAKIGYLGEPAMAFSSKPTFYGEYIDVTKRVIKKISMPLVKISYPASSVNPILNKMPYLYSKKDFNNLYKAGGSVIGWQGQDTSLQIALGFKGRLDTSPKIEREAGLSINLIPPMIFDIVKSDLKTSIRETTFRAGDFMILTGRAFGMKKPKVWIEMVSGTKTKKVPCQVVMPLPFANPDGKAHKSATVAETGESRISITLPKKFPSEFQYGSCVLVIDSGAGLGAIKIKIEKSVF